MSKAKIGHDEEVVAGHAAIWIDNHGEAHDLGMGWETEEELRADLDAQGAEDYDVYRAVSYDGGRSWERYDD